MIFGDGPLESPCSWLSNELSPKLRRPFEVIEVDCELRQSGVFCGSKWIRSESDDQPTTDAPKDACIAQPRKTKVSMPSRAVPKEPSAEARKTARQLDALWGSKWKPPPVYLYIYM